MIDVNKKNNLTEFEKKTLAYTSKIRRGTVSTYGDIAKMIGRPGSSRAVGNALHKNPFAPKVPCHRVVKSDGKTGGFAGGKQKKISLLLSEGIKVRNGRIINFNKHRFIFS